MWYMYMYTCSFKTGVNTWNFLYAKLIFGAIVEGASSFSAIECYKQAREISWQEHITIYIIQG